MNLGIPSKSSDANVLAPDATLTVAALSSQLTVSLKSGSPISGFKIKLTWDFFFFDLVLRAGGEVLIADSSESEESLLALLLSEEMRTSLLARTNCFPVSSGSKQV